MQSITGKLLAGGVLGAVLACAPAALAEEEMPTLTLSRDAFNAARGVEIGTQSREKAFSDYTSIWTGIYRDEKVDASELAFLSMQIDGEKQVRLKGEATADWAPADIVFNGNWMKGSSLGYEPPLMYMRARAAWWMVENMPVAELEGEWPELVVSAAAFEHLKSVPVPAYPRSSVEARTITGRMLTDQPDAAARTRLFEAMSSGPIILLLRNEEGGEPAAFVNVWSGSATRVLQGMLPDAKLYPLWTGAPEDVVKLAEVHAKSPEDAAHVVDFLARQLEPLKAESTRLNAWQPLRAYMAQAKTVIKHQVPEAAQPAARQMVHDALKQVVESMDPAPPSVLYTFILRE